MSSRTRDLLDLEAEGDESSTPVINLVPIVDAINSGRFIRSTGTMNSNHNTALDRLQFLKLKW